MPQVKISVEARADLKRLVDFLVDAGVSNKAQEILITIIRALNTLGDNPLIGRIYTPLQELVNYRELVIKYGRSGYVALYSINSTDDSVVIHAIKHQREVGYDID